MRPMARDLPSTSVRFERWPPRSGRLLHRGRCFRRNVQKCTKKERIVLCTRALTLITGLSLAAREGRTGPGVIVGHVSHMRTIWCTYVFLGCVVKILRNSLPGNLQYRHEKTYASLLIGGITSCIIRKVQVGVDAFLDTNTVEYIPQSRCARVGTSSVDVAGVFARGQVPSGRGAAGLLALLVGTVAAVGHGCRAWGYWKRDRPTSSDELATEATAGLWPASKQASGGSPRHCVPG
eukprot:COSAG02_NODE_8287_length_2631_cov_25.944322_2_plen_236_part_00